MKSAPFLIRPTVLVVLLAGLGLSPQTRADPLEVLWYTYAAAGSEYRQKISQLSRMVHTLPQSDGSGWNLTYWHAGDPAPDFTAFDVLVIESGEAFLTGPPDGPPARPDFSGILDNKTALEAARGGRAFITTSDADFHAIRGDAGSVPVDPDAPNRGGRCVPAITAPECWDGALGHAVNAINWAGNGNGLGIVSFLDGEFEGSFWWTHPDSFLRDELDGYIDYAGSEQNPIINSCQALHPLNAGLTSAGLSNWTNSFHATFLPIHGYAPVVSSSLRPGSAVAIAKSDAWLDPWNSVTLLGVVGEEEDDECASPQATSRQNELQTGEAGDVGEAADTGAPSSGAR
ncbi:hypothetical protein C8R31_104168 [Nitrosospira sp. Nsp2]|uniref:PEP-CTERM sorting domain-containing protein n=1 Tax=Nitrosospira sp. Nsp2 TaxID=136548 RepID=UPI000D2FA56B|nr:PEP-CTERM sorting domain-containing protein [Nitrosospira sp. Nsp2]PTR15139.1 hypothetical protein C8R31_104168 [Nitrosospira sp. Nsp2]